MNWIIRPLKQYAVFTGRSSRAEFWMFLLFATGLTLLAHYIDGVAGGSTPVAIGMGIGELSVTLLFLLPTIAVGVRRLHDSARSGLWMLLGYGPLVLMNLTTGIDRALILIVVGAQIMGGLAWVVMMLLPGTIGPNRFGADPRGSR